MATTTTSYGSITITEVQEGSQIWTTTVAPNSPNYTFAISNLTGDPETSVKAGDIIMYSYYRYTVLSISSDGTTVLAGNRVSIRGETGASAVTYSLIVSNLAIVKDKNGNISPISITLTAKSQTDSSAMSNYAGRFKIETTTDNSTWTTQYTSSANESTKTWNVIDDIIAIRCSLYLKDGTTTLLDQQTIPVINDGLDGTNGNDAYSIVLTNDNHTFAGNTTSAITSQMECNVIAYKGTAQVAATIGTITGQPTGMTTTLLNNGTTNSAFRVSVTGDMTTRNGTLNIPLTVDGKSFTKEFTYSLALNGEPLFKVELDNYYSAIPVDSDGKAISKCIVEVHFIGRKGEDPVATSLVRSSGGEYPKLFGISPQVINSTISYNSSMHATKVISGYILYTIPKDTVITNDKGNISFKFNLDGASHNLEYNYCWSKVTQGKDGGRWYSGTSITGTSTTATVFSGSGISSAVEGDMYLNTSTYNTYRCTLGGDASTAKWVYVNNIKGVHGDTGKGVSSITNQYYLSTSNTTQTGGSWSTTVPPYVEDCYYWTKSHIVWTDNTETDTTAVLDNGLTDANANAIDARKVATNYLAVDNTGIMVADMEDGEQTPSTATGRNVFIDNDSVNIRNGTTTLASFTGDNTRFYDPIYNKELATFGASGAIIGANNEQRFVIEKDGIKSINASGATVFSVNSTEGTVVTEAEVAPSGETDVWSSTSITLDTVGSGSSVDVTFYNKSMTAIIVIEYCNSNLTNVKVNSVSSSAIRTSGFAYGFNASTYSIDLPPFTFTHGTAQTTTYTITASFVNIFGDSYDLTAVETVTYNGAITITLSSFKGKCVRTSGNHEEESKVSGLWSKVIYGEIYQSSAYTKAPAMTFGTRGKNAILAPFSVTIGEDLYANNDNQLSIGKYNLNDDEFSTQLAFAIGNGADDTDRSNAFNVDWDGNTEVMGNLEVNNNQTVTNNLSVGGNETVTGGLTVNGTITDNSNSYSLIKNLNVGTFKLSTRTPVYRKRFYWTAEIGANSSWSRIGTNASLDGYTPVGVVSFGCFNASSGASSNVDWCVITKCYVWGDTLDVCVWNQNTGASARCGVYVDVLYFAIGMI